MVKELEVESINDYINMKTVILGNPLNSRFKLTVNFIVLYAKYFIHITKLQKTDRITMNNFLRFLKNKLEINMIIAKNKCNENFIQDVSALNVCLQDMHGVSSRNQR